MAEGTVAKKQSHVSENTLLSLLSASVVVIESQ